MSAVDFIVAPLAAAALFVLFGLLHPAKECSGDCGSCTGAAGTCPGPASTERSRARSTARFTEGGKS